MELCSMLYGSLDGRGFGGEWIHVYAQLSPFTVYLKLSQHCQTGYTTVQNEKFKKKFESLLRSKVLKYFSNISI